MRNGALILALILLTSLWLWQPGYAQLSNKSTTVAELKISYPIAATVATRTDKVSFTVQKEEALKISLSLPILTGSHKGWIGIINSQTKEEIWETMIDASKGPQKFYETKTFKPGVYRMIVEYSEVVGPAKAKWLGSLVISR